MDPSKQLIGDQSDQVPTSDDAGQQKVTYLEPREIRVGGYIIPHQIIEEWGARIRNIPVENLFSTPSMRRHITAYLSINRRLMDMQKENKEVTTLILVGEEADGNDHRIMYPTRSGPIKAYKDMPAELIPQFEEGGEEMAAKEFLESQDVPTPELEFVTVLC
ncbi:hypothetical protein CPB84DRAFT_1373686 [Gymnopilus junonius]|uniref:Uncharacterized protein n=1 Tax=Gymnopilus junonius TaxID=109634 RepID=A0A9P5TKC6_GYMJU|nr:hypothetical protein CPB84DRAFT_1373686 [Gymnopilus junonius]